MGPRAKPLKGAILHVWHANSQGFYSHFDPTREQTPFNNRRRISLTTMDAMHLPFEGAARQLPPGGACDTLMQALGRKGDRPAHVHSSSRRRAIAR